MASALSKQCCIKLLLHHVLHRNKNLLPRHCLPCLACQVHQQSDGFTWQQKAYCHFQSKTFAKLLQCDSQRFVNGSCYSQTANRALEQRHQHLHKSRSSRDLFSQNEPSALKPLVFLRQASRARKPVASRFTEGIDLDSLKEQLKLERKKHGKNVQLPAVIKEAIAEKCDAAIANLSEADARSLKVIQLEHNFLYSEGYEIPATEEMTSENWLEAMNCQSKSQRLKYYLFLQKRKALKENALKKKESKKEMKIITPMNQYEHGKIFMRIYDSTMKKGYNHKLASAMQFGVPLVIDMDFEKHMRPQEIKNTAHQLLDLYAYNRLDAIEPFHLHFTSCPETNSIYRLLQILFQDHQDFLATVTEKSYLDLFKKEDLVYLSPNGRQVLRQFDPNTVYIVGAFNDKATQEPVTFAKAKQQKIKCMRLPLDQHISWVQGGKDLTLDQMIRILLAVKGKKPWDEAFQFIPKRKRVRDM